MGEAPPLFMLCLCHHQGFSDLPPCEQVCPNQSRGSRDHFSRAARWPRVQDCKDTVIRFSGLSRSTNALKIQLEARDFHSCFHIFHVIPLPRDCLSFQMGALDNTEWELFLRKMIARNLRIFGAPDPVRSAIHIQLLVLQLSKFP